MAISPHTLKIWLKRRPALEKIPTWKLVVAGALQRNDGCWLMHKRPLNKHHGGLWEFPGGKVELAETPVNALIRELEEELDIAVEPADCLPAAFAQEPLELSQRPLVILLYKISSWAGHPKACEGGEVAWYSSDVVHSLSKPPLDVELAKSLFAKEAR